MVQMNVCVPMSFANNPIYSIGLDRLNMWKQEEASVMDEEEQR